MCGFSLGKKRGGRIEGCVKNWIVVDWGGLCLTCILIVGRSIAMVKSFQII